MRSVRSFQPSMSRGETVNCARSHVRGVRRGGRWTLVTSSAEPVLGRLGTHHLLSKRYDRRTPTLCWEANTYAGLDSTLRSGNDRHAAVRKSSHG